MQPRFNTSGTETRLFPQVSDGITFDHIVPKFPWEAFHVLANVSPAWREAIRSHRVHNARKQSCTMNTLVVHVHRYEGDKLISQGLACSGAVRTSVYCSRRRWCFNLPRIPGHYRGLPFAGACVSLDSVLFVMGGAVELGLHSDSKTQCFETNGHASSKVYMLDLALASSWRECASMTQPRSDFGCAVVDGKIYVFGGTSGGKTVPGDEVYNPAIDAWAPINAMPSFWVGHRAAVVDGLIFVYGGYYMAPAAKQWATCAAGDPGDHAGPEIPSSWNQPFVYLEVYDSISGKWTVDPRKHEDKESRGAREIFVVGGKFYLMGVECMTVLRGDGYFTHFKCHKYPSVFENKMDGLASVALVTSSNDHELFAGILTKDFSEGSQYHSGLFKSTRFTRESRTVSWRQVTYCPIDWDFMHCIQL